MATLDCRCVHCTTAVEKPCKLLGQLIDCPSCGEVIEVQESLKLPLPSRQAQLRPGVPKLKLPKPPQSARRQGSKQREYKVFAQSDERFADGWTPARFEEALNDFAAKGWQVVSVLNPGAPGGAGESWMVILSRFK